MSDFYNKYPYTDFHELNLDWVIERVKKLTEDWLATQEEWHNTQEEWQQLHDYVMNYFANLDVQDEINNKINQMILDGTFLSVVAPTINQTVVDTTTSWLAAHITQPTTPAIDNTLSIAGAAADAKAAGDGINQDYVNIQDLRNAVNNIDNVEVFEFTNNIYYATNGATVDISNPTASNTYKAAVIACQPGDLFIIKGMGGGSPRLWCFTDSSYNVVSVSISNRSENGAMISAPVSAAFLIINTYDKNGFCYKVNGRYKKVTLTETTRFIGASGYADAPDRRGVVFSLEPNRKYKIVSENNNAIAYVYLSAMPAASDVTPPYAYIGRVNYANRTNYTLIAPQDNNAKYVWVPSVFNGIEYNISVYDMGASDTITIAAADSGAFTDLCDIVCDGVNDEIDFRIATDGLTNGGKIKMSCGNFYFDSFDAYDHSCVLTGYNNGQARTITYEGTIENKAYNTRKGTTIHITSTAISGRVLNVTNSVFVGTTTKPPTDPGDDSYTFTYVNNVNFVNFYLYTDSAFEGFVGINCINYGCSLIKQVCVATEDFFYNRFHHIKQTTPEVDSIGIISCNSSNDEMALCSYEDCDIGGMYIAYKFIGIDHLVMRNCFAARNVYGFWFETNYKTQTMINCADEGNYHGPHFEGSGHLTMIDMCVEPSLYYPDDPTAIPRTHATEATPGQWKGSISYTGQGYKPYWESGSGINFDMRCLEDNFATYGAAPSNPDFLQRYFDKTNNVWKTWNGSAWV